MHKHNTELSPSYITVMSDQYQKSCRQKNLGKQIVSAGYIFKQMGESLAKIDKRTVYCYMFVSCCDVKTNNNQSPTPPTNFCLII